MLFTFELQTTPRFPNDFFQGSDRWYEAKYAPGAGWTLTASDVRSNKPVAVSSAARVVIKDNVMVLVVPTSEFKVPKPKYRVTVFRHTGDFGINPPHNYGGSIWPAVADGLSAYP